ncbi:amidase [Chelatococcus reniformis]|uniref:Amidase n=1 Tax=Chelatococcus reniformis TaxID=1494448 RepID=A0A916XDI8_9HYPH|nr:amidase [Chelatococcus reniformis]GGC63748.1 amidase [Chelatococcus reniformis]
MHHETFKAFMPYPPVAVAHAPTGPLSGLSFAVKDVIDVAGYPTSCGTPLKLAASGIKPSTAPVVQQLLDAGARFAGKTHTDEFAFSILGRNCHFGTPINPAAPGRIPGGSSSGSAVAVAARLVDFALGTDTGGSLRAPASYCGIFGIRPTFGRVDNSLCEPLAGSFDTVGWFARDAKMLARVGAVLLGPDTTSLPGAARFLIARSCFAVAKPETAAELEGVLRRVELRLGMLDDTTDAAPNIDDLYWAFRHMQSREAWEAHHTFIEEVEPPLAPALAERFAFGKDVTDSLVAEARALRVRFRQHLTALLGEGTVLVLPTMPAPPPFLNEADAAIEDFRNRTVRLLCLASLAGFPQVTIPVIESDSGPLGLSLLGPAGSDRSLIQLASRVAEAARERIA